MIILIFEAFKSKFGIHNRAMSNIKIKYIGRDISLIPIEIEMRDQTLDSIRNLLRRSVNLTSTLL